MRNVRKSPVVILFIVAAVLYAIIYILPQVTGVLRSSYTAEYGELKTFDKVEGYFVRSESYLYIQRKSGHERKLIIINRSCPFSVIGFSVWFYARDGVEAPGRAVCRIDRLPLFGGKLIY